jgi:phosphatidylglycerophosphate synthase
MKHGFTSSLRYVRRRYITCWMSKRQGCFPIRTGQSCCHSKIGFRNFSQAPGGKGEDEGEEAHTIWTQLKSPPNLITLARIASTPLLAYWIISEEYELAMFGVVIASISDGADGYLAKRYNMSTVVGSYLDPIADKVMVNVLGVSLLYSGVLPTPLVALWATKDVLLLSGTAYNVYQRHNSVNIFATSNMSKTYVVSLLHVHTPITFQRSRLTNRMEWNDGSQNSQVKPTSLGKASTFFQFTTLAVGISTPVLGLAPVILDNMWYDYTFSCVQNRSV